MAVRPNLMDVNTLYDLSSTVVINYFNLYEKDLISLPDNILFDLYYKLYKDNRICLLGWELVDLNVFARMLKVTHKRLQLLQCFQSLMDHGTDISKELAVSYADKCMCSQMCPSLLESTIDLGLRLGAFLSDAGWFKDSESVLVHCRDLCLCARETPASLRRTLECYHKLFNVQAAYCLFPEAAQTYQEIHELILTLRKMNELPNLAALYKEFSIHFFLRSEYDKAHKWSVEALKQLVPGLPATVVIDVLRQLSKTCVVKRQFKKAEVVIRQAVRMANEVYEPNHFKLADALLDYGFFLLNYDCINHCVKVINKALDIKKATYRRKNIYVASALEDLAYALYVYEYSTGRFKRARDFSEDAIVILEELLPPNHLMLSSAKRVKALILEEIALDMQSNALVDSLLPDAELLHITALELSVKALGDNNVQTAKHYGNLGRLYQSMKKYKEAEEMHLKAIAIKEERLGKDDYEVGLSVGHLASLYAYHTKQYEKAVEHYLRSIEIGLKLFGETYSGLEYDYRGLCHVYGKLHDVERVAHYTFVLNQWKVLREQLSMQESKIVLDETGPLQPLPDIIDFFFKD
ncbi:amyloid protein-binding protein 2 isoform X1 [Frankliniella occidentalis]|uniref:Amyloid protein-binding protein 2 isoform X1 n=1 Tax=Frankliniella occidentalis TaxID=133901 RepID=A0A6J1TEX2_FRAOC|nr:amyloid protein-binding protein 2 isoform X1 [Frankliniella occidentalis]